MSALRSQYLPSSPARQPASKRVPWLQHAVAAGAAFQTARIGWRVRRKADPVAEQRTAWQNLVTRLAVTEFGAKHGLSARLRYADFRRQIAPQVYEQFAPWIDRMKRGEANVLWPGCCHYYAVSSGTTQGRTKYLPVTDEMLTHFRRAGLDSLCLYARRTGNVGVFRGRHLFLGGSTALAPIPHASFSAWAGDLSGITARHLPAWAKQHLYEPGTAIAQIADWPEKLRAMAQRTAARDIRLIAGIPSWILVFAETLRSQTGLPTLKAAWPQLECLIHGGVPVAPFARELASVLGDGVNLHEVYPASEAFIAAQDDEPAAGLRLLTDAAVFYEFLPMSQFDETRLSDLAAHVIPLAEVRADIDYALVMTTPGGLCRYVIGDVVRFISTEPPRLIYVGRTRLQLSAFGEHVIEKEVTDTITTVCARHSLVIGNFHVAPVFVNADRGVTRGRHEWWLELRSPGAAVLDASAMAAEIDRELRRLNDDYDAKRQGDGLDSPLVRLVPEGTFEDWLRHRGKWGGQNKMPRCRSDREIADELARFLATARNRSQPYLRED
jgi:hypothetical protein